MLESAQSKSNGSGEAPSGKTRNPGGTARLPEAQFVMDGAQRIVRWSDAATFVFGVPGSVALAQPCFELVRGRDPFGKAVCGPGCAPMRALEDGQLAARCSLWLSDRDGPRKNLSCALIALPDGSGGALATLSERERRPSTTAGAGAIAPLIDRSEGSATELMQDLAVVASLATSLSPDDVEGSTQRALRSICQATDAEVAELFLVEPGDGDLLLTAHSGPFKSAFSQITRFHPAEGFPGIARSSGEPAVTGNLRDEPRFLRTAVKDKGFLSYICVPVRGARGDVGVIGVASRSPHFQHDRVRRLLTWVSQPIATFLQASLLQIRETVTIEAAAAIAHPRQDFDGFLQSVLHETMLIADAAGGALILYDRAVEGVVRRVTEGEFAGVICPDIRVGQPQHCPALQGQHGVALSGPRRDWPEQCRQVPAGASMTYCLPLVAAGEEVGIIQLGFNGRAPSPPTKHLAVLLNFAERSAEAIRQARASLQRQQPALPDPSAADRSLAEDCGPAAGEDGRNAATPPSAESSEPASRRMLEIRCFGSFEMHLRGKLVTPEMFDRRGALTLLKILLIQGGRPISREALTELLWPGAEPHAAANRLYVLVNALRRVIEPAQQGRRWTFVCSDGGHYYLNPGAPLRLDTTEFRECVSLGEQLSREGDIAGAIEAFEAAVDLYRGDLLEEEPNADWFREQRTHLQEICLSVLGTLAGVYLHQGALEDSIDRYRRALKIDPMREGNHRGLMRALWTAGRRDEALREYELCRDILRRELDVEPLPETEALHAHIRNSPHPEPLPQP